MLPRASAKMPNDHVLGVWLRHTWRADRSAPGFALTESVNMRINSDTLGLWISAPT
jgi:hypothetical protein